MRWVNSFLWFGAAGFAYWYNATHPASKMLLPFFPASNVEEATASGHKTVFLLVTIGSLFLIYAVFTFLSDLLRKKPDPSE